MSNKMIEEIKNEVAKIKENRHSTSNKRILRRTSQSIIF